MLSDAIENPTSLATSPTAFVSPYTVRNKAARAMWTLVYWTIYRWTPPRMGMFWRRLLLRAFGAKLGQTWIHPSTRIWAPWKLRSGDGVYIDRNCNLYNAFGVEIGDRVVISFDTLLCTATHDYESPAYPLHGAPITIGSDCWIAAQSCVLPGVTIGPGAVVGIRSVVTKSVDPWTVVVGHPCKSVKKRAMTRQL